MTPHSPPPPSVSLRTQITERDDSLRGTTFPQIQVFDYTVGGDIPVSPGFAAG